MEWYVLAVVLAVLFLAIIATGIPVAFGIGLLGLVGLWVRGGIDPATSMLILTAGRVSTNYVLMTVPLFMFMGEVLVASRIGGDLFEFSDRWLGRLPGGLAISSVGACAIFGAISGSTAAATATIGSVAVPEMLKRGYDKRLATGPVTAAAALAPIIPPSISLILYAVVTEQSVGDLFMAGFIPGFMLAGIMALQIFVMVKRHPGRAPTAPSPNWRERMVSLGKTWPAVLLILMVLGTIYLGICTATEAAALGALGALCIGMGMGRLRFRELLTPARRAMATSCMIFMVIIGAYIFGGLLAIDRIPHALAAWVASLPVSRWFIMAGIQAMFFILGFFLDVATLIVIVVPIIFPITQALGFDPVWLGIVLHINFAIAVITPPMALNLYVMSGIMRGVVSFEDIVRGTMPFIISEVIAMIAVMVFPPLALWLPRVMR